MRKFLILCTLTATLVLPGTGLAQWGQSPYGTDRWTLHPTYPVPFEPNSPLAPGSIINPYVLDGPRGQQYQLRPQYPTPFAPGQGPLAPGSSINPWHLERK